MKPLTVKDKKFLVNYVTTWWPVYRAKMRGLIGTHEATKRDLLKMARKDMEKIYEGDELLRVMSVIDMLMSAKMSNMSIHYSMI